MSKRNVFFSLFIILVMNLTAQTLNREVKALIEITKNEDSFMVSAKAENLSKINQSLSYELKVFKEEKKSGNKSSNIQSGRFVIEYGDVKKLATTVINSNEKDEEIILLFLIRNIDDEIIGKARKVIADGKIVKDVYKVTLKKAPNDGIRLTGVVFEKVKTKPGRDFYGYFYSQFLIYNFKDSRTVLVEEVFSRGRTTKIHVKIDNKKIFEFFVQPRTDYLKNNARIAARLVYDNFSKKEKKYIVKY